MNIIKRRRHRIEAYPEIFGFQRLGDSRYSLSYDTVAAALRVSCAIRDKGMLHLAVDLGQAAGRSVVIDIAVAGYGLTLSMLYKVVCAMDGSTYVEWWARRRTDPDLLALWVDVLTLIAREEGDPPEGALELACEVFEFCRRSIAENPFQSLGLETGATGSEVSRSYRERVALCRTLVRRQAQTLHDARIRNRLEQALVSIEQAHTALETPEGRAWATAHFAPS